MVDKRTAYLELFYSLAVDFLKASCPALAEPFRSSVNEEVWSERIHELEQGEGQ